MGNFLTKHNRRPNHNSINWYQQIIYRHSQGSTIQQIILNAIIGGSIQEDGGIAMRQLHMFDPPAVCEAIMGMKGVQSAIPAAVAVLENLSNNFCEQQVPQPPDDMMQQTNMDIAEPASVEIE